MVEVIDFHVSFLWCNVFVCFQGCHNTTAWPDPGSLDGATALQSSPALERTIASSGTETNLHAFLSNTQPAANRPANYLPATSSSQAALAKENHAPVTDRAAVGFDCTGKGAQADAAEQASKVIGSCWGAGTKLACDSMHTDQYEGSGCISQRQLLGNRILTTHEHTQLHPDSPSADVL